MTGVTCELTERELDVMTAMKLAGAFDVFAGQVILNFDPNGVLTDIDTNRRMFTRKKLVVVKKTVTMKSTQLL